MSLSVVVPVYNEQDIIEVVIRSIHNNITSKIKDSELIVVNDCSTDDTLSVLHKLSKDIKEMRIITPAKNGGHGKAIRLGFLNAKKDWVFHIDSDNQFDPAEYWKLDQFKDKYDLILGYRKKRYDPIHRMIITSMVRLMNLLFFGTFIKDSNSAFKLINNKVLQHILTMVPEDAMVPTIMITLLTKQLGYRIKLVGITHFPRKTGKVSIQGLKLAKICYRGAMDNIKFRIKTLLLPRDVYKKASQIRMENRSL